jgi:putative transposase
MNENNKQSVEYDPDMHHRRSIRFRGFDYSRTGDYFLTIVAHNRRCLFGEIVDGRVELSPVGQIVLSEWRKTPAVRSEIELDECVIMPNHIHGIIRISVGADGIRPNNHGAHPNPSRQPRTLGAFVAGFKAAVTRSIRQHLHLQDKPIWQRNYYEHIIRNWKDLNRVRDYIRTNPARWDEDDENPNNVGTDGVHPHTNKGHTPCAPTADVFVGADGIRPKK